MRFTQDIKVHKVVSMELGLHLKIVFMVVREEGWTPSIFLNTNICFVDIPSQTQMCYLRSS